MNCYVHLEKTAVGMCSECGKNICEICLNKESGKMYCDLCSRLKAEKVNNNDRNRNSPSVISNKNKGTATVLALLLGGIGAHKFYLGQFGMGIFYCVFCWTFIPAGVAFIEGILYLVQSEEDFARKYGMKVYN